MAIEKGEKVMKFHAVFKLPSNFEGDLNDALEILLAYRKSKKNHEKTYKWNLDLDLYENWWAMVNETDRPLIASTWFAEFDGEELVELETKLG